MNLLSRRSVLAIAAVVDVALHSRSTPVHAMAMAARHKLPPRHLETLLHGLVRAEILKGVRGPRGGYELARERRRITEIVRTAMSLSTADPEDLGANSVLLERVIDPAVRTAGETFLANLDAITVEQMCETAENACARRRKGQRRVRHLTLVFAAFYSFVPHKIFHSSGWRNPKLQRPLSGSWQCPLNVDTSRPECANSCHSSDAANG